MPYQLKTPVRWYTKAGREVANFETLDQAADLLSQSLVPMHDATEHTLEFAADWNRVCVHCNWIAEDAPSPENFDCDCTLRQHAARALASIKRLIRELHRSDDSAERKEEVVQERLFMVATYLGLETDQPDSITSKPFAITLVIHVIERNDPTMQGPFSTS